MIRSLFSLISINVTFEGYFKNKRTFVVAYFGYALLKI